MRYAVLFALLAVACAVGAWQSAHLYRIFLGWSALSFAWLALAYQMRFPQLLGKRGDGKLDTLQVLVLAPYHVLNALSYSLVRLLAREDAANEIVPGVWLARRWCRRDLELFKSIAPRAILDAAAEMPEHRALRSGRLTYLSIPLLDTAAPTADEMRSAAVWIESQVWRGPVVVHCALGHGRSATLVAAFLILSSQALTADEALAMIRAQRPRIELSPEQMQALQVLERSQAAIFW